jgi:ATP-binding cassette subfamily B (MDR/TAP) protein 1
MEKQYNMEVSSPSTLESVSTVRERVLYDLDIQDDIAEEKSQFQQAVKKSLLYMLFIKKDIPFQIFAVLVTIAAALSPAISAILMGRVFDVLANLLNGKYSDYDDYMHHITLATMALLALGAGTIPLLWMTITSWMMIGEKHGSRARLLMLKTYLEKNLDWYESNNDQGVGDLTLLNRCVEELRAGNSEATALTLENFFTICALLGTSFYYSWSVTLVMLASSPIIITITLVFSKLIEKYTALENMESAKAAKIFDWSLSSAKLVRLFQTQAQEYRHFHDAVRLCKRAFVKLSLVSSLNMGSLRFIILCMFVQGFWFGSDQVRKGNVSAGDVLTCFTSCLMLGESFRSMLPQIITIQKANVAMRRIQGFIEIRSNKVINYHDEKITKISLYPGVCHGDIKFKNVDFSYPTRCQTQILKDVNLHFPKGNLTFVVGRSGSGKSTLSNLLLDFYSPSRGRVEIDGFSVSDVNKDWLTDNITLVEQSCTLFNDTIKNNILMGNNNPEINSTNENFKIQEAVQISLLQEVVRDLPDGLDTLIGNAGVQLSGGQQQRVAIARAKLRDSPILILDESVSALDIVLKDLIVEAVKKWRHGKTTIILTHEYNQIKEDDFVYLMEDGRVAEFGRRSDLELKPNGIFQKLSSLQDTTIVSEGNNEFVGPKKNTTTNIESSEFLHNASSRLSSQLLSSLNPLSMFNDKDEPSNDANNHVLKKNIQRRRNRRNLNKDLEMGTIKEEPSTEEKKSQNERPELTPIKQIIIKMFKSIEKKSILFLGITFSLLNGAVNPVFSYCFAKLLVGIVPQSADSDVGKPSYLLKWSLIVIFLALFDGISTFLKDFLLDYSSEIWVFALRTRVFNVISRQSLNWFTLKNNTASEINTLVLNDSRDLRNLVSQFLSIISTVIVLSSLGLTWALVKGWKLSLVCISLIPLFILVTSLYAGWLQASENEYKNAVADLETQLYEIVSGIKTIKTLKLNDHFRKKFDEKMNILYKVSKRRAFLTGFGVAVTTALTFVVQGILLYYGMKLIGKKEYTVNRTMETFTLLLFSIMSCAQLMNSIPEVSRGQRAGSYIFKILELLPSETETRGTKIPNEPNGRSDLVEFKNLNFSYPSAPNQRVLKRVSFKVAKNEHVSIIGESGSGKSTITLLLTRLFEFTDSSVFFHNEDINEIDVSWLRNKIALVDQKATFFDGTVYENLTYGLTNPNESKIIETLKMANVYEFVQSLPLGLQTRIDTSLISGGQAQRLSIARALLRDPQLLILDECTSALDSESSYRIAQLIQNNLKGITVIMITHSEEMMRISDSVLTMKNGSLVEEGPFDELFNKRGELFRIVTAGLQG